MVAAAAAMAAVTRTEYLKEEARQLKTSLAAAHRKLEVR